MLRIIGFAVAFGVAAVVLLEGGARLAERLGRYRPKVTNESFLQPNPYLHMVPKPGVSVQSHGARVDINSLGFRNEEFAPRKPTGLYRAFALGGSTTFGYSGSIPNNQETYSYKLQQELRKRLGTDRIEVINAGVVGYTLRTSLVNFATRLTWYEPDMLIVNHAFNDMIVPKDEDDLYRGIVRTTSEPSPWDYFGNASYFVLELKYRFYQHFQRPAVAPSQRSGQPSSATLQSYERNLRFLVALAQSMGVQVVIAHEGAILPSSCEGLKIMGADRVGLEPIEQQVCFAAGWYFPHLTLAGVQRSYEKIAAIQQNIAAENKLVWLDMNRVVPKTAEHYADICHTRPAATTLIAKALADALQPSVALKLTSKSKIGAQGL